MAKKMQGVRFETEEIDVINEYAQFTGKSFSMVVRESTMAYLEDEIDTTTLKAAIAEDSGDYVTLDEAEKELL